MRPFTLLNGTFSYRIIGYKLGLSSAGRGGPARGRADTKSGVVCQRPPAAARGPGGAGGGAGRGGVCQPRAHTCRVPPPHGAPAQSRAASAHKAARVTAAREKSRRTNGATPAPGALPAVGRNSLLRAYLITVMTLDRLHEAVSAARRGGAAGRWRRAPHAAPDPARPCPARGRHVRARAGGRGGGGRGGSWRAAPPALLSLALAPSFPLAPDL